MAVGLASADTGGGSPGARLLREVTGSLSTKCCSATIAKRERSREDGSAREKITAAPIPAGRRRGGGRAGTARQGAGAGRLEASFRHYAEHRLLELALRQALERLRAAIPRGDRRQGQLRDAVLPDLQSAHRCRAVDRRLVL